MLLDMTEVPFTAPEFALPDSKGQIHSLQDYRGKWLVLYFYPRDATSGCTIEVCSFRDTHDDIAEQVGADIVGISLDSPASHAKFSQDQKLNFTLLSDESGEVIRAYGAWGKKMFGKEGTLRKTFIIDPAGVVRKVYDTVTPEGHGQEVLNELKNIKAAFDASAYGAGSFDM